MRCAEGGWLHLHRDQTLLLQRQPRFYWWHEAPLPGGAMNRQFTGRCKRQRAESRCSPGTCPNKSPGTAPAQRLRVRWRTPARRTEALPREAALTAARRAAPSPSSTRTANFPVRRRCLPVRCGRCAPQPSGARPTHDAAEGNVKFIELDTARRDGDEGRENPRKVTSLPRFPPGAPRGEAGRPRPPPARRSPRGGSLTPRTPARGRRAAAPRPLPPPPTPALPTATAPRPRASPPRGVGGERAARLPSQPGSGGTRRVPPPPRLFRVN